MSAATSLAQHCIEVVVSLCSQYCMSSVLSLWHRYGAAIDFASALIHISAAFSFALSSVDPSRYSMKSSKSVSCGSSFISLIQSEASPLNFSKLRSTRGSNRDKKLPDRKSPIAFMFMVVRRGVDREEILEERRGCEMNKCQGEKSQSGCEARVDVRPRWM
jgi:hypothetical protein